MIKNIPGRKPRIFYYDYRYKIYLESDLLNADFLTSGMSWIFYIIVFPLAIIVKEILENALSLFRTLLLSMTAAG